MGFGIKWRQWISQCIRTTSLSVLINGSPTAPIRMEKGLRQGDPLSPFLFLLVTEAFNQIMKRGIEKDLIQGIKVGNDQINISHLQFADDTLVFCPARSGVISNIRRMMDCYYVLSGLRINYSKSACLPLGCTSSWVSHIEHKLGCQVVSLPISYLGIPLGSNPKSEATWAPIINKVQSNLAKWKSKVLSRAGRLTLIKSVLNNLPVYYLSLFKMPKKVVRKIIGLQRRFF